MGREVALAARISYFGLGMRTRNEDEKLSAPWNGMISKADET